MKRIAKIRLALLRYGIVKYGYNSKAYERYINALFKVYID